MEVLFLSMIHKLKKEVNASIIGGVVPDSIKRFVGYIAHLTVNKTEQTLTSIDQKKSNRVESSAIYNHFIDMHIA